jgi:hypothetical protein
MASAMHAGGRSLRAEARVVEIHAPEDAIFAPVPARHNLRICWIIDASG